MYVVVVYIMYYMNFIVYSVRVCTLFYIPMVHKSLHSMQKCMLNQWLLADFSCF